MPESPRDFLQSPTSWEMGKIVKSCSMSPYFNLVVFRLGKLKKSVSSANVLKTNNKN